jgi:proteasome lid subunit RPN8/RPN11
MSKKNKSNNPDPKPEGKSAEDKAADDKAAERLSVGGWDETPPPVRRKFPGPPGARASMRVAIDKTAMAEINQHARDNLDCEVAGVLVGEICEDDAGTFVHARAAIRADTAKTGSVSVTYTSETWTKLHEVRERDYPKYRIVGWYHTHPGFGVQFSAMDEFVHNNFLGGAEMVALVTDPIGGDLGVLINGEGRMEYLPRIWVDGREQPCFVKAEDPSPAADGDAPAAARPAAAAAIDPDVEARLNSLIQAIDDIRTDYQRMQMVIFIFVCLGVLGAVGWTVYRNYKVHNEPPEILSMTDVPVMLDGKEVRIGIGVASWPVPDEVTSREYYRRQGAQDAIEDMFFRAAYAPEQFAAEVEFYKEQRDRAEKERADKLKEAEEAEAARRRRNEPRDTTPSPRPTP